MPAAELGDPLTTGWLAAGVAGLVATAIAIGFLPAFQRLLGDIPLGALIELEDLSHPLLVQIAESSPGTWQHSLAMANMAQIAAYAIGADGRLVRVGAYYHDLGKSLQPKYFIENLSGGEASPHDALPPPVSCDAIFAHVTEGVRVARRHGLHERVIDFMHMHHGDGLLEYFWVKCQEQGNPNHLVEADFRYPGIKPDSRETAILAICDAVEAASRTLRSPDAAAIEGLVQRIVYGKLHLGQLDDSGLTVADLRVISSSLMETIKHAHHGRIEYPWQRAARARAEEASLTPTARPRGAPPGQVLVAEARPDEADASDAAGSGNTPPAGPPADGMSATARLLSQPRLDSLDAPRPSSRTRGPARGSRRLENAATEQMAADPAPTVSLVRPPTAAEVAAATHPGMTPPAGSGTIRAAASARALTLGPSAALDAAATLSLLDPDPPAESGEPRAERAGPAGDDADEARPARPQRS
jgi:putative nucleotidyltransferase with HDIG domain